MISKDKTYRTRDGREVRIYATDGSHPFVIHGAYRVGTNWIPCSWTKHGMSTLQEQCVTDFDLFEVKPRIKRTVWLHVYRDTTFASDTRIQRCMGNPLALFEVKIDCEEGEGL